MVLLVAMNARYHHCAPGVRVLAQVLRREGIDAAYLETSIGEPHEQVLRAVHARGADMLGLSCYIWNIEAMLRLACEIKLLAPKLYVFLGGPEVSFNASEILKEHPYVDAVVKGEGEPLLPALARSPASPPPGVAFRRDGQIVDDDVQGLLCDLSDQPFPYTDQELTNAAGRILYYESSRGCPFSCSYCLASRTGGVRTVPMARVKEDLLRFIRHKVPLVKLTDRTFNADEERAREVLSFLIAQNGQTQFHFEIAGHLLSGRTIDLVKQAPKGLLRFEIGVQTTTLHALDAVSRKTDFEALSRAVKRLRQETQVELHLDLIAGLPGETLEEVAGSFNDVYALNPHMLQLGFLKLLYGSRARREAAENGCVYSPYPPYEVLKTDALSYEDLLRVKRCCLALERYGNNGNAPAALEYLLTLHAPFELFECLGAALEGKGAVSREAALHALYGCGISLGAVPEVLRELLRYDHYAKDRHLGASWLRREYTQGEVQRIKEALRGEPAGCYAHLFWIDVPAFLSTGKLVKEETLMIFGR